MAFFCKRKRDTRPGNVSVGNEIRLRWCGALSTTLSCQHCLALLWSCFTCGWIGVARWTTACILSWIFLQIPRLFHQFARCFRCISVTLRKKNILWSYENWQFPRIFAFCSDLTRCETDLSNYVNSSAFKYPVEFSYWFVFSGERSYVNSKRQ